MANLHSVVFRNLACYSYLGRGAESLQGQAGPPENLILRLATRH